MLSVPADFASTRAPAVPAMTAANAAATTRRIAQRLFRPSMYFPPEKKSPYDRSSLWQRNHILGGGSIDPCASLDVPRRHKFGLPDPEPRTPAPEAGIAARHHQPHAPVDVVLDAVSVRERAVGRVAVLEEDVPP